MADQAEHHTTRPDLNARRVMALGVISDLVTEHGLTMPMHINFSDGPRYSYPGINLRLEEDDREGVHRWADALDLTVRTEKQFDAPAWTAVEAQNDRQPGHPVWLYFEIVSVWAACDRAGEQA